MPNGLFSGLFFFDSKGIIITGLIVCLCCLVLRSSMVYVYRDGKFIFLLFNLKPMCYEYRYEIHQSLC